MRHGIHEDAVDEPRELAVIEEGLEARIASALLGAPRSQVQIAENVEVHHGR
jgi:hypothetical protein